MRINIIFLVARLIFKYYYDHRNYDILVDYWVRDAIFRQSGKENTAF